MSMPKFGQLTGGESLTELIDIVAKVQKQLIWLMNGNLDSKNAREFGGWRVSLDSLESKDGTVGMSTEYTDANDIRYWAGSAAREAAPFQVYEDGKLVAKDGEFEGHISTSTFESGVITGALIRTADETTFPRIELSNTENILTAFKDAWNSVVMSADSVGSPMMQFNAPGVEGWIYAASSGGVRNFVISTISGHGNLQLTGDEVRLSPSIGSVHVPNWSRFYSDGDRESLQSALNSLSYSISSLSSDISSLENRVSALESAGSSPPKP